LEVGNLGILAQGFVRDEQFGVLFHDNLMRWDEMRKRFLV
jgi:hypothetical protein